MTITATATTGNFDSFVRTTIIGAEGYIPTIYTDNANTGSVLVYDVTSAHVFTGTSGDNTLQLDTSNDVAYGLDGNDFIRATTSGNYAGDDFLIGGNGDDTLWDDAGNDIGFGGAGNDYLTLSSGDNTLFGGTGDDTLNCSDGISSAHNIMYGDEGADILIGGGSVDTFMFEAYSAFVGGTDTIQNFDASHDKIDISDLLQDFNPTTDAITSFVQITTSGSDSILSVDMDGVGAAYSFTQVALIQGVTGLTDEAALVASGALAVVYDPIVATNDTSTGNEDTTQTVSILNNDTGFIPGDLSISIGTSPAHGTATVNLDHTVTYTPSSNFNGTDSFVYEITDPVGRTSHGTVNLTVNAVNDAPIAANDTFHVTIDTAYTGNVLVNNGSGADSDPDGDTLSVTSGTYSTSHGSVVVSSNGDFTYTPTSSYAGTDSFTYGLSDGHGGSATGNASITVGPVNHAPHATDDILPEISGQANTGNILIDNGRGPDSDPDGDTLSITSGTFSTAHGSITLSSNGDYSYTPTSGYTGEDNFSYALSDGHGGSDTGNVSLFVFSSAHVFTGTSGDNTLQLDTSNDLAYGLDGNDFIRATTSANYAGDDFLMGGNGNDTLWDDAGNDIGFGGPGDDVLTLSSGNDLLFGGPGNDTLYGEDGTAPMLYGDAGADTLIGGVSGVDHFMFEAYSAFVGGTDTIENFNPSQDKIDISDLLEVYNPVTDAITDFVQITTSGSDSILSVDMDGAGSAHSFTQVALIQGVTGLTDEAALVTAGALIV